MSSDLRGSHSHQMRCTLIMFLDFLVQLTTGTGWNRHSYSWNWNCSRPILRLDAVLKINMVPISIVPFLSPLIRPEWRAGYFAWLCLVLGLLRWTCVTNVRLNFSGTGSAADSTGVDSADNTGTDKLDSDDVSGSAVATMVPALLIAGPFRTHAITLGFCLRAVFTLVAFFATEQRYKLVF